MGRKLGAMLPFGGLDPYVTKVALAEAYLHSKWHLDLASRLAATEMGRKLGGLRPLFWGTAGSPSNTKLPGPRPTSIPSGILICPTVWPQYTNVTDGQTNRTGQQSDSIGQNPFTNGHPKTWSQSCSSFFPFSEMFIFLFWDKVSNLNTHILYVCHTSIPVTYSVIIIVVIIIIVIYFAQK